MLIQSGKRQGSARKLRHCSRYRRNTGKLGVKSLCWWYATQEMPLNHTEKKNPYRNIKRRTRKKRQRKGKTEEQEEEERLKPSDCSKVAVLLFLLLATWKLKFKRHLISLASQEGSHSHNPGSTPALPYYAASANPGAKGSCSQRQRRGQRQRHMPSVSSRSKSSAARGGPGAGRAFSRGAYWMPPF